MTTTLLRAPNPGEGGGYDVSAPIAVGLPEADVPTKVGAVDFQFDATEGRPHRDRLHRRCAPANSDAVSSSVASPASGSPRRAQPRRTATTAHGYRDG